ncbi:MAG: lyase family protein [Polyangiaceae bacterium]
METHRREHDALGEILVPAGALWGAQTQRAIPAFAVSGLTTRDRPDLVVGLALVKQAAARANMALGALDLGRGAGVERAAAEVAAGRHDDQFPLDLVQGGGGTATNMNMNEVIANLANVAAGGALGAYMPVHPNDHVNRSQSTNDAYPTGMQIAVLRVGARAIAGVSRLREAFVAASERDGDLVRLGRTCVQDAVPLTVRETHLAHANALGRTAASFERALAELHAVPLGATAIGTGIGAPKGYRKRAVAELAQLSGFPLVPSPDMFDALQNLDAYVGVASAAVQIALVIGKIAADLRFLSSGPTGGIGEVLLPKALVGSSIMPGKINPVIPELAMQVAFDVRAAAHAVEMAVGGGELELNIFEPVVARHLLGALDELGRLGPIFAERCVDGLVWNRDRVRQNLGGSVAGLVEMSTREGYEAATEEAQRHRS